MSLEGKVARSTANTRELLRFGANPYLLAADMGRIIFQAASELISYQLLEEGGVPAFFEAMSKRIHQLHCQEFCAEHLDEAGREAWFVRRNVRQHANFKDASPFSLLDDYRRFFKVFGMHLTQFERLTEFQRDPFLAWMIFDERSQRTLVNVARTQDEPNRTQIDRGVEFLGKEDEGRIIAERRQEILAALQAALADPDDIDPDDPDLLNRLNMEGQRLASAWCTRRTANVGGDCGGRIRDLDGIPGNVRVLACAVRTPT